MIFVHDGAGSYTFMQHATWDGLQVADLIFPWLVQCLRGFYALMNDDELRESFAIAPAAQVLVDYGCLHSYIFEVLLQEIPASTAYSCEKDFDTIVETSFPWPDSWNHWAV